MPDVPAIQIESEAWRIVSESLLSQEELASDRESARARLGDSERVRRDHRSDIDAEVAKLRKILESLVDQPSKVEPAALIDAIDRRAKELEAMIVN